MLCWAVESLWKKQGKKSSKYSFFDSVFKLQRPTANRTRKKHEIKWNESFACAHKFIVSFSQYNNSLFIEFFSQEKKSTREKSLFVNLKFSFSIHAVLQGEHNNTDAHNERENEIFVWKANEMKARWIKWTENALFSVCRKLKNESERSGKISNKLRTVKHVLIKR